MQGARCHLGFGLRSTTRAKRRINLDSENARASVMLTVATGFMKEVRWQTSERKQAGEALAEAGTLRSGASRG